MIIPHKALFIKGLSCQVVMVLWLFCTLFTRGRTKGTFHTQFKKEKGLNRGFILFTMWLILKMWKNRCIKLARQFLSVSVFVSHTYTHYNWTSEKDFRCHLREEMWHNKQHSPWVSVFGVTGSVHQLRWHNHWRCYICLKNPRGLEPGARSQEPGKDRVRCGEVLWWACCKFTASPALQGGWVPPENTYSTNSGRYMHTCSAHMQTCTRTPLSSR